MLKGLFRGFVEGVYLTTPSPATGLQGDIRVYFVVCLNVRGTRHIHRSIGHTCNRTRETNRSFGTINYQARSGI